MIQHCTSFSYAHKTASCLIVTDTPVHTRCVFMHVTSSVRQDSMVSFSFLAVIGVFLVIQVVHGMKLQ